MQHDEKASWVGMIMYYLEAKIDHHKQEAFVVAMNWICLTYLWLVFSCSSWFSKMEYNGNRIYECRYDCKGNKSGVSAAIYFRHDSPLLRCRHFLL